MLLDSLENASDAFSLISWVGEESLRGGVSRLVSPAWYWATLGSAFAKDFQDGDKGVVSWEGGDPVGISMSSSCRAA